MNVVYYESPFPHAVIENFYSSQELDLIWEELKFLTHPSKMKPPQYTDTAKDPTGEALKNNSGLFLDKIFPNRNISNILTVSRKFFDGKLAEAIGLNNIIGKYIKFSQSDTTLLSYYENGGYYKPHVDFATLTAVTWIYKEPKQFVGGQFSFTEFEHEIPLQNNKTVIFPSCYEHGVESVMMVNDHVDYFSCNGRYTITNFISV